MRNNENDDDSASDERNSSNNVPLEGILSSTNRFQSEYSGSDPLTLNLLVMAMIEFRK